LTSRSPHVRQVLADLPPQGIVITTLFLLWSTWSPSLNEMLRAMCNMPGNLMVFSCLSWSLSPSGSYLPHQRISAPEPGHRYAESSYKRLPVSPKSSILSGHQRGEQYGVHGAPYSHLVPSPIYLDTNRNIHMRHRRQPSWFLDDQQDLVRPPASRAYIT